MGGGLARNPGYRGSEIRPRREDEHVAVLGSWGLGDLLLWGDDAGTEDEERTGGKAPEGAAASASSVDQHGPPGPAPKETMDRQPERKESKQVDSPRGSEQE